MESTKRELEQLARNIYGYKSWSVSKLNSRDRLLKDFLCITDDECLINILRDYTKPEDLSHLSEEELEKIAHGTSLKLLRAKYSLFLERLKVGQVAVFTKQPGNLKVPVAFEALWREIKSFENGKGIKIKQTGEKTPTKAEPPSNSQPQLAKDNGIMLVEERNMQVQDTSCQPHCDSKPNQHNKPDSQPAKPSSQEQSTPLKQRYHELVNEYTRLYHLHNQNMPYDRDHMKKVYDEMTRLEKQVNDTKQQQPQSQ